MRANDQSTGKAPADAVSASEQVWRSADRVLLAVGLSEAEQSVAASEQGVTP